VVLVLIRLASRKFHFVPLRCRRRIGFCGVSRRGASVIKRDFLVKCGLSAGQMLGSCNFACADGSAQDA